MSMIAEYVLERVEKIAAKTKYDADYLFDRVVELTDDGQTIDEAIAEVGAIAEEGDY